MTQPTRILVTPRDPNPYQSLLYNEFDASLWDVRYAEGPTRSQTINVLAKPLMLLWYRTRGFTVLHVHWVYEFSLPWARSSPLALRILQLWFGFYLRVANLMGYSVVWTAHNVVPHRQVFFNDRQAREVLIRRAAAVISLGADTLPALRELGAADISIIPLGTYEFENVATPARADARRELGFVTDDCVVAVIGRIERYKGVDRWFTAVAALPARSRIRLLVAGDCADTELRSNLEHLAAACPQRVRLVLEWLSDEDLARGIAAADVIAFGFRSVTNSSSVVLAMSQGRPVIVPDVAQFRILPEASCFRFEPEREESLMETLCRAEHCSQIELDAMGFAARSHATSFDWSDASRATQAIYRTLARR